MQKINKYDGGSCSNLTYRREVKSYYRQRDHSVPCWQWSIQDPVHATQAHGSLLNSHETESKGFVCMDANVLFLGHIALITNKYISKKYPSYMHHFSLSEQNTALMNRAGVAGRMAGIQSPGLWHPNPGSKSCLWLGLGNFKERLISAKCYCKMSLWNSNKMQSVGFVYMDTNFPFESCAQKKLCPLT